MPLYEFKCAKCGWKDDLFFLKYEESLSPQSCPVCQEEVTRLFPLPRFNVMNKDYRPGCETKWNWNPAAAFGDGRECGAEYEHRRREIMTGRHRHDIGGHKREWAHHLKGTKRWHKRRKAACRVH